jgi:hypothetical protein
MPVISPEVTPAVTASFKLDPVSNEAPVEVMPERMPATSAGFV